MALVIKRNGGCFYFRHQFKTTKKDTMNYKLQLHKERLEKMLQIIRSHERVEELWDFDQPFVKQHEERTIMEYSAEFAALNQLAFDQIKESKAKPSLDRYEVDLLSQEILT